MPDFSDTLALLLGGEQYVPLNEPEFQPGLRWDKWMDILFYQTRDCLDCPLVRESIGWYLSILWSGKDSNEMVGLTLEPFSALVGIVRDTYPRIGVDGKDFPLWQFIRISAGAEDIFPGKEKEKVENLLSKIRELVGIAAVPSALLQEVRHGKPC